MIILFTAGQLGNQVFQYGFADSIRNKYEKIVTSKCDYFDVFEYKQDDYIFATSGGELGNVKLGSLLKNKLNCKLIIN